VAFLQRKSREYMALPVQKPRARTDDLVVEEVDDELLIYDAKSKRGHCLSANAARVWRACDGHSDVTALSEALDLNAEVVSQALDELGALELLDTQGVKVVQAGSGNGNGLTRRQLTSRSAKIGVGLAAGSLIYTVNASPAWATPTPFVCSLFTAQSCGTSTSCGRTEGCCCCCQGESGSCKVCGSVAFCNAGTQPCPGGTTATHCSSTGDQPADDRGCCGFTGSMNCGCAFGPPGTAGAPKSGCCDRNTHVPCTPSDSNPDCVPCCAGQPIPQPPADVSNVVPGCCKSAVVNCCAAPLSPADQLCCNRSTATIDCCAANPPACCATGTC
jgi:hypothetical protein